MLEITCQGSEVEVVALDDLLVIRASNGETAVNIPITRETFRNLTDEAKALAA